MQVATNAIPPSKKHRASEEPPLRGGGRNDPLSTFSNDVIARRRAELRQLESRSSASDSSKSTSGLLAKARSQLGTTMSSSPLPSRLPPISTKDSSPTPMARMPRVGSSRLPHSKIPKTTISDGFSMRQPSPRKSLLKPPSPMRSRSPSLRQPPAFVSAVASAPAPVSVSLPAPEKEPPLPHNSLPNDPPADTVMDSQPAPRLSAVVEPPSTPAAPTVTPSQVPQKLESKFSSAARSKSAPPARQSPVHSKAASNSSTNGAMRPLPITPSLSFTAAETNGVATRRAKFEQIRKYAEEKSGHSHELDMVRELRKATQAKEDAYRQVARLREQMHQLQQNQQQTAKATPSSSSSVPFAGATTNSIANGATPTRGVRPSRVGAFASTPALAPGRKRVATPHPKAVENQEEFMKQATESTPDEFSSNSATYFIRRPYGGQPSNSATTKLWKTVGLISQEQYARKATIRDPSTLEVAARIGADTSVLTLSGKCTVRHRKTNETEWKVFENVDDRETAMGWVTFIDKDANEGEYWLDEIYEEAMATRETYCSSLAATASALKLHSIRPKPRAENGTAQKQAIQAEQLQERRALAVETNTQPAGTQQKKAETDLTARPKMKTIQPFSEVDDDEAATDHLSWIVGRFFSSIFSLVWFLLVRLPLRVLLTAVVYIAASAVVHIIWMYSADDNGAYGMNAGLGHGYNKPGIL